MLRVGLGFIQSLGTEVTGIESRQPLHQIRQPATFHLSSFFTKWKSSASAFWTDRSLSMEASRGNVLFSFSLLSWVGLIPDTWKQQAPGHDGRIRV